MSRDFLYLYCWGCRKTPFLVTLQPRIKILKMSDRFTKKYSKKVFLSAISCPICWFLSICPWCWHSCKRRKTEVAYFLDIMDDTVQVPLNVYLWFTPKRKSPHSFCASNIPEHRLDNAHALTVNQSPESGIYFFFHPAGIYIAAVGTPEQAARSFGVLMRNTFRSEFTIAAITEFGDVFVVCQIVSGQIWIGI